MDREQWNKQAREINIKSFIKEHKREPVTYSEVLDWIHNQILEKVILKKETIEIVAYINGMVIPIKI